ncbi:hypothetical protein OG787_45465 [Streptomyces sp. NBC_00075]|uniref:hypothetical protein n=1 Tax=Streptomyces sp. NBC_00075 TaxID=2975641 RepID=UPI00324BC81C
MSHATGTAVGAADSAQAFPRIRSNPRSRSERADRRDDTYERHRRHRRHSLELLAVCAVGLVPWTVLLALTLPSDYQVHEWRATWVGFDVLLVAAMASTVHFGWRRRRAVVASAIATAVLLVCDAWFDVSLAFGTPDIWLSGALAVFVELPMAVFLIHRVHSMVPSMPWPVQSPSDQESSRPDGVTCVR